MSFPPELPSSAGRPYENRKTGLTVFGILTVLIGCVCALFVPLMLLGRTAAAKTSGSAQDLQMILPGMIMYGSLAVGFVWLGIGSMKARRWARALLLIVSWSWLLIGIVGTAFMAFALPKIMAAAKTAAPPESPQAEFMPVFLAVMVAIVGVIMVIIPAVWVFFYQSRHVKATCEAEDPVERWTDRSPLPVITICIWMVFSVPSTLVMAAEGVIPFFGMLVVGPAASAIYLLLATLWVYAAWAMYKLQPRGWWIMTASLVLFAISAFLTYSRHDVSELYRLMGYSADQIAQIQKFSFLTGTGMAWLTLGAALPFLCYMLFLRRYFVRAPARVL